MVKTLAAVLVVASVGVARAGEAPQAVDAEGLPVEPPSMVQPLPPGTATATDDAPTDETPPLSGGRLAGEFAIGGLFAVGGGIGGAYIGYGIEMRNGCNGELCGLGGAVLGGLAGLALVTPAGVYMVGTTDGQTGSFGATLAGSVVGTLAGVGAVAASDGSEAGAVMLFAAPVVGAMVGFNATRKYTGGHKRRAWVPVASSVHGTTSLGVVGRF